MVKYENTYLIGDDILSVSRSALKDGVKNSCPEQRPINSSTWVDFESSKKSTIIIN